MVDAHRLGVDRRVGRGVRGTRNPGGRATGADASGTGRARLHRDDGLRRRFLRREADGAHAVFETVDAFVGQVEPFIVRRARGCASPTVHTTRFGGGLAEYAPGHARPDPFGRGAALRSATTPRDRVAVDGCCDARRRSVYAAWASSMSSCSAACTRSGLGTSFSTTGRSRPMSMRTSPDPNRPCPHVRRTATSLPRLCSTSSRTRTKMPLRRIIRRVVIVARRVSHARNGSRQPSSTRNTAAPTAASCCHASPSDADGIGGRARDDDEQQGGQDQHAGMTAHTRDHALRRLRRRRGRAGCRGTRHMPINTSDA